jgi:hypothetical protein
MEMKLAPITSLLFAEKLALPMVEPQAAGLYTPPQAPATWQDKDKQYPHQHLLLPADTTKAKLMQICRNTSPNADDDAYVDLGCF